MALCVLVLASATGVAFAAAGQLDSSFDLDGKQTFGFANGNRDDAGLGVRIQPDGGIVVAGSSDQGPPTGYDFALSRLTSDGALDQTFSGDGRRTLDFAADGDEAYATAIQGNGRIVAVGYAYMSVARGSDLAIARFKPGGGIDKTFSGDGKRAIGFGNGAGLDDAFGVAIQRDGRIVVVGDSEQGAAGYDLAIARFMPDGSLDNSFSGDGRRTMRFANNSGDDGFYDVAIQRDGKIVAVGSAYQGVSAGYEAAIVRFNPNGGFDKTFSGDGKRLIHYGSGDDDAFGVALRRGKIVIAGDGERPATGNDFALARLKGDGSLDKTFSGDGRQTFGFANGSGSDGALDVAIHADGRIVAVGASGQGGTTGDDWAIARLTPSGGLDQNFAGDGRRTISFDDGALGDSANGVAIQANGRIVAAGYEGQAVAPGKDFAVARFRGG